jgi:hypothetical protein
VVKVSTRKWLFFWLVVPQRSRNKDCRVNYADFRPSSVMASIAIHHLLPRTRRCVFERYLLLRVVYRYQGLFVESRCPLLFVSGAVLQVLALTLASGVLAVLLISLSC